MLISYLSNAKKAKHITQKLSEFILNRESNNINNVLNENLIQCHYCSNKSHIIKIVLS